VFLSILRELSPLGFSPKNLFYLTHAFYFISHNPKIKANASFYLILVAQLTPELTAQLKPK
jgi:hypothetical protein